MGKQRQGKPSVTAIRRRPQAKHEHKVPTSQFHAGEDAGVRSFGDPNLLSQAISKRLPLISQPGGACKFRAAIG
jgi:hypothetical protein